MVKSFLAPNHFYNDQINVVFTETKLKQNQTTTLTTLKETQKKAAKARVR